LEKKEDFSSIIIIFFFLKKKKVFFKPLKERPDLISENELMNIFSNMESIFEFNYAFYEKLGERLLTWTTEKFDINIIGDLFLELV